MTATKNGKEFTENPAAAATLEAVLTFWEEDPDEVDPDKDAEEEPETSEAAAMVPDGVWDADADAEPLASVLEEDVVSWSLDMLVELGFKVERDSDLELWSEEDVLEAKEWDRVALPLLVLLISEVEVMFFEWLADWLLDWLVDWLLEVLVALVMLFGVGLAMCPPLNKVL